MTDENDIKPAPTSDDDASDADVHVVPNRRSRRHRGDADAQASRRFLFIVLPLVMIGAGIAGVFLTQMKDTAIYSKPVDELLAQKAKFAGRPVRADGNLVHGSLVKRDTPCEYRFTMTKNGVDMPVRYAQCVVPDTFRDIPGMDVGVTVEGEVQADNSFEATNVLAKCPSKYDMKEKAAKGEKMHALTSSDGPGNEGAMPSGAASAPTSVTY